MSDFSADLRNKLRRLGVKKGARHLKSAPVKPPPSRFEPSTPSPRRVPQPIEHYFPTGQSMSNQFGDYFVVDTVYRLDAAHGDLRLDALDASAVRTLCQLSQLPDEATDYRNWLFLDTETTGLAGAGTLAFMVGVGFFERNAFVVRQYFLRDLHEEPAMLADLFALAQEKSALVTFNGRTFDIPLLVSRGVLNRQLDPFDEMPHLDLLHPARRIWRRRLGSVALGELEKKLLGVHRTQEDVPGFLIPTLYKQYVMSGDAQEMAGIFYHNRLDILSMVTLLGVLSRAVAQPSAWPHALDRLGIGRWQLAMGQAGAAEETLDALFGDQQMPPMSRQQAGWLLSQQHKRKQQRDRAVALWLALVELQPADRLVLIELAKHAEWHAKELDAALSWTERALECAEAESNWSNSAEIAELRHRKRRIERKLLKIT